MKIALLGDIALFGITSKESNLNYKDFFKGISDYLSNFDYVVGNLETPFSVKKKKYGNKSAYLCSDPVNVEILSMLHINAVTLANNHIFDFGKESFELTQKILDKAGIAWFGVNGKEHFLEKEGNKLAFSGFCCYSSNPINCVEYGKYGVNELDVDNAYRILKQCHKNGYLNVCAVHAGIEHINYPSIDTIEIARKLAQIGNVIYYGHHPHVVQPIEKIDDSLIAYSLGNFCFDDISGKTIKGNPTVKMSENNRKSVLLSVTIEHNQIKYYEIIPIYIGRDKIHLNKGYEVKDIEDFYKTMVNESTENYLEIRRKQRFIWINERKQKRNFSWYLHHVQPRYFKLFYSQIRNRNNYKLHVTKYL